MSGVVFGREWNITTAAEYRAAMNELADAEFIAEMSDSYAVTRREKDEIDRQRENVLRQAKENNILKEETKNA